MGTLRRRLGALIHDWPRLLRTPWLAMHNRDETLTLDGRGARCEWQFTSELHIANVFPTTGARLMRQAFAEWPIEMGDAPAMDGVPEVSFIIGHRGLSRLPHLLATLRTIAAQRDVAVECIVVEQSATREIETALPRWVRYVHVPVAADYDYNRAWTLNVGARLARGGLLVLHDNDMLCPARYAAEALAISREGYGFADLKRFTFYLPEGTSREVFESGRVPANVPSTIVQNLRGASIVAARDAYVAVGGFDESFIGWGGEDLEFWERVATVAKVYAFGYLPFIHLWHSPQKGKLDGFDAPAIRRYYDLAGVPAAERIERLRARPWGSTAAPSAE